MSSLKTRLKNIQQEKNVAWEVVELDYALSWVLAAVAADPELHDCLVFKGGTCLKKCYFGSKYRYSQDLDFTMIQELDDHELTNYVNIAATLATELSAAIGSGVIFTAEAYAEKGPHPLRQKAYILRAMFPWQREGLTKIKFEVSRDEKIFHQPKELIIMHEYGEVFAHKIQAYSLEEIIAEKYRGILQNQQHLRNKGWIRSRVRDFYDLWRILNDFRQEINLTNFKPFFIEKCKLKDIQFKGPEQFFDNEPYLAKIKKDWDQYLGALVHELPNFDELILRLKRLTYEIF